MKPGGRIAIAGSSLSSLEAGGAPLWRLAGRLLR
jgi:hypothetical protein